MSEDFDDYEPESSVQLCPLCDTDEDVHICRACSQRMDAATLPDIVEGVIATIDHLLDEWDEAWPGETEDMQLRLKAHVLDRMLPGKGPRIA